MHLNGESMESPDESHEMLDAESSTVAGRVSDLERKVLEQGDELVCLKATLAEALRRLNALEGMRVGQAPLTPSPRANGNQAGKESPYRQRPLSYSTSRVDGPPRRAFVGSALPQRKAFHYQSTGSLHSDGQSSSSVSPVPSPSPRATPLPVNGKRAQAGNAASPTAAPTSPAGIHKRWSSTGDFQQQNGLNNSYGGMQSKFLAKSYLNLCPKQNGIQTMNYKHGTKDATYNEDEGTVRIFFRGRPAVLHAPSGLAENYNVNQVNKAPGRRLRLDWVYGYRGRDCRSNLYFLPTGEMVYFVAALVVLYNVEEQNQRHYAEHTDDVKSLAVHPNKMLVATGQCCGHDKSNAKAHVRIWNSVTLHTQAVVGSNDFVLSVCCLSFSKADGGALLAAVDEASDHNISVWDWQKGEHGHKVAETKCSVDTVVAAEFHPLDRGAIVTCGKSHVAFWSLDAVAGAIYRRAGAFESRDKPKYVTCIAFLQTGETVTGDSNGNLSVWARGSHAIHKMARAAHDGPVFALCVTKDGRVVTGGGRDGRIAVYDAGLNERLGGGDASRVEGHFGGVRVISEGRGAQLLVGTTRNCILVGSPELGFQPVVLGHADEVWGLAAHPRVPQFATCGYDKVLQLWDSMSHGILWSKDIGEQSQCLSFSRDGSCVLVGCTNGKWMIFDTQTRELLGQHVDGAEAIQAIRFSPDGSTVALGSRDRNIYVYQVSDDGLKYSRVGRCSGHSSYITHLDWSSDNQTLRSNSGDYELLFWNAGTCRQIPQSGVMRDVDWSTNTCSVTFGTLGAWPESADGTDVNYCDRSHDGELLATADDFGKVKLYGYPASQPKSLCHSYGGHSSHVTAVHFLHDDTRLVSIGGRDTAVLQWAVT